MAWGRKKSGGAREPRFGLAAALADLRLDPKDRIPDADDKPKKAAAKRKPEEDEDDDPPPPPPRERKSRDKRGGKRRSRLRLPVNLPRLIYWGAVLSLWAAIFGIGVVLWVRAHFPPIQSLEIPKRPPTIEIVGADGSMLAQRGEMAGANVALKRSEERRVG